MSNKPEYTPVDSASSCTLLFLLASALGWLVIGGVLAIVAALQLHSPAFLAHCPVFTYGRVTVMAETSFVYGWLANAGLALVLWVLGRLAGEPLRAQNWALGGTLFWNVGVTAAVVGAACGELTGFSLLGLPKFVQLILFASYIAIAIPGLLAWTGRLRQVSFASHWYGAAALFIFPWLISIVHVMLFAVPVRGVLQPIIAGWYAQCAWTLWIAPLFLCVAYYVVPKVTGKTMPSYEFASLGFWTLLFVGGLTGGRHLIGGPVPAWIPSLAVVSCALLLFHTLIVFLNLKGGVCGGTVATRFISFGLAAYILGALVDVVTSFHGIALHTQFTLFDEAQKQLALYGAATTVLFGGIYFALPRITGKAWFSGALVKAHLTLTLAGILLLLVSLVLASVTQSQELLDKNIPLGDIAGHMQVWLSGAIVAQVILLLGNVAFTANFYLTSCRILNISAPAWFATPAATETHVS
ncbi:MAG TPA: cbb3-type cytochrome c oxidase subunit I [Opitutaceae bacterium]|nr:cbb3-type cytochrome c oxidase subunit I [Opitutaceae bacterium]